MANPAPFPNRPFNLRTVVWTSSQDIANNRSYIGWQIWVDKTGYSPTFSNDGQADRSMRFDEVLVGNVDSTGFDFTGAGPWKIASGYSYITHTANGTLTFDIRAVANYAILGSTQVTTTYTPATIPRASTASFVGGSALTTGASKTINTNRASSSFTHDITYNFQGQTGTIATGVATTTSWTPDPSLFDIPALANLASASGTITTVTKNGATVIGSKATAFTLTLADDATGQPTWASIAADEAVTSPDVETLVGKYVQGVSKITGTFTDAVGVEGSSVTNKKFTVGVQTVNVAGTSDTTPNPLSLSGTQDVTFEVTDSRGRKKTDAISIDVLPYNVPSGTSFTAYRAGATGATADPQGTRLAVTINASAASLMNGSEKNRLTVKVYTSPHDAGTWTLQATPVLDSATLSQAVAVGFGTVGDFGLTSSYDVKVEVTDIFGALTMSPFIATVTVGTIFQHWSTGMGVNKFWEQGALDVGGDIYQSGNLVIDQSDAANNTDTQTGTDTTKYVTPAGLGSVVGVGTGYRYSETIKFTSSGTFSKASYPGIRAVRVRVVGGGGGGGGSATAAAGQNSYGTGGGGGGYAEAFILASALSSSVTVTVGAGGTSAVASEGTSGSSSSFGTAVVATGGLFGYPKGSSTLGGYTASGAGGEGTAGDILLAGGGGTGGTGAGTLSLSGSGGSSVMGGGGRSIGSGAGSASNVGEPGGNYGGGGGGAATNASGTGRLGGSGGNGVVLVEIYR